MRSICKCSELLEGIFSGACNDSGNLEELAEIQLVVKGGWGYGERWGRFQPGKMCEVIEMEMQRLSSVVVSEQTILTKHTCIISMKNK